jgi:hypothetical protein
MMKRRQTTGSSPRSVKLSSSACTVAPGGAFDNRQRMLVAFAVDANGGDQCQLIADMQLIDVDREQIANRDRSDDIHAAVRSAGKLDGPARDG